MNKKTKSEKLAAMLAAFVFGFLLSLTGRAAGASKEINSASELQKSILAYAEKNEELSRKNIELSKYVDSLEEEIRGGEKDKAESVKNLRQSMIFAGLTEVEGNGFLIRLEPRKNAEVSDAVLRLFINELSAFGSSAIAINDQRKVAMTEIRDSGKHVVINGVPYRNDEVFEIKALTDDAKNSYIESGLLNLAENLAKKSKMPSIEIKQIDKLKIPALKNAGLFIDEKGD